MATTRTRDGTLPSRTYQAVTRGVRTRDGDAVVKPGLKDYPRAGNGSQNSVKHMIDASTPRVICRLKAPNFTDEIGRILGDKDKPYYGLFADDAEAANTKNTTPTAEDRALCGQLGKFATKHRLKQGETPVAHAEGSRLTIHYGETYAMDAWYHSAYPAEYTRRDYLAVCSYCLNYTVSDLTAERHGIKCSQRTPPGREVYRDGDISVWEVDGTNASLYCQNLCLLAKAFLSSKSLYRDVQPFFFYVLTKTDENGAEFLGYFSKQKMYSLFRPIEPIQCVSCIMALPFTQQQGYGQFLIDFSYLLAQQQEATGGPETPLSELGERAFRSYWKRKVCYKIKELLEGNKAFTISLLSKETGIHINHTVLALEDLGWLTPDNAQSANPVLRINKNQMNSVIEKWEARNPIMAHKELLMWVPLYE